MPDEEKTGFTVVDRRAAQSDAADDPRPAETQDAPSEPEVNSSQAQESASQGAGDGDAAGEEPRGLPDPTFLLSMASLQMSTREMMQALLAIFDEQALRSLGLMASPLTGQTETDLPSAQLAIDCTHFFLTKLDGGFSDTERREAQRRLTDLRLNYLARAKEA